MNTQQMLNELNARRVQAGMTTLNKWKQSRAKLQDAIDALSPVSGSRRSQLSIDCEREKLNAKVVRAWARRHDVPRDANTVAAYIAARDNA
jgi:hypothetical protein